MKKLFCFALALTLLFSLSATAFAADAGVQNLSAPETETEPVSLKDFKLNAEAEIDGWGSITATKGDFTDDLQCHDKDHRFNFYSSGKDADYYLIWMDITNTTLKEKDYLRDETVTVIYDDKYEYAGFCYQYDYNALYGDEYVLYPDQNFAIEPMYTGHYVFGCTLPNAIVEGKKPLRMIITIDGSEIVYNIRK